MQKMAPYRKMLKILYASIAILLVSITLLGIVFLNISSKDTAPTFMINPAEWQFNPGYISGFISIVTGLITILFPISLSIVSSSKTAYFNSKEISDVVFKHHTYKKIFYAIPILIFFSLCSMLKTIPA